MTGVTWEELFADFDSHIADSYVPFPGLHEVLAELSQRYALGIITNGKGEFQQRSQVHALLGPAPRAIRVAS